MRLWLVSGGIIRADEWDGDTVIDSIIGVYDDEAFPAALEDVESVHRVIPATLNEPIMVNATGPQWYEEFPISVVVKQNEADEWQRAHLTVTVFCEAHGRKLEVCQSVHHPQREPLVITYTGSFYSGPPTKEYQDLVREAANAALTVDDRLWLRVQAA